MPQVGASTGVQHLYPGHERHTGILDLHIAIHIVILCKLNWSECHAMNVAVLGQLMLGSQSHRLRTSDPSNAAGLD